MQIGSAVPMHLRTTAAAILFSALFVLVHGNALASFSVKDVASALDRAEEPRVFAEQAAQLETFIKGQQNSPADALAQLARAYYLLGEAEQDKKKKPAYLDKSVNAADRALKAAPGDYIATYWRSMSLLQKADLKGGFSALGYVKDALKGLEAVSQKDPSYDFAGAFRSRGKVLIEAPGWAFIGDKKKGLELLQKAKKIAPNLLVNRLYLAQAYKANGMPGEAMTELVYINGAPARTNDDLKTKEEAKKLYNSF